MDRLRIGDVVAEHQGREFLLTQEISRERQLPRLGNEVVLEHGKITAGERVGRGLFTQNRIGSSPKTVMGLKGFGSMS